MPISTVTLQERDTVCNISHIWGPGILPSRKITWLSIQCIFGNAALQYWLEGTGMTLRHIQFILHEPSFFNESHSPVPI